MLSAPAGLRQASDSLLARGCALAATPTDWDAVERNRFQLLFRNSPDIRRAPEVDLCRRGASPSAMGAEMFPASVSNRVGESPWLRASANATFATPSTFATIWAVSSGGHRSIHFVKPHSAARHFGTVDRTRWRKHRAMALSQTEGRNDSCEDGRTIFGRAIETCQRRRRAR